ncbi:hypothetical protein JOH50_004859 [Rhizobium leguminosarum]|uniref:restriction endonuclease subunit S n=1 Tax=Rhizobium leguminosarum TaxID=384 RepID=UPI001AE79CBA|nr:restriction endonuclease subunit S [Rhizobium leguminosarum]MBP2489132.1 hypothetical protein [Rhizobium leguminosarum]
MLERKIFSEAWTRIRFDQMAAQINDRVDNPAEAEVDRYVGLEHLDPDSLHIRRWGEPTDVEATKLRFQPDDIIFGKRRVYQRKVAVADFEGICSAHAMVLRAKPGLILPMFLPFFMQSDYFMERALSISVGSLSPTINWKTLASEEFIIPSFQEQARYVEALTAVSNSRSSLVELERSLGSATSSLSEELFRAVLDKSGPTTVRIGEIFDHVIDRGYSDLPVLSVTIDGLVVPREELERHVSDETGDEKYLRVKPGDLAYNTMRLWQGAIGIVQEEGLISPAYTVLRPKESSVDVTFFWEMMRSSVMKRVYRKLVTGVASDRWRLYYKDLSTVSLNLAQGEREAQLWSALKQFRVQKAEVRTRFQQVDAASRLIHQGLFGQ